MIHHQRTEIRPIFVDHACSMTRMTSLRVFKATTKRLTVMRPLARTTNTIWAVATTMMLKKRKKKERIWSL